MSSRLKLSGKELIVMLLYTPNTLGEVNVPIRGRTRLVKMMFLFRQELYRKVKFDEVIDERDLPNFKAWKFGPFSKDIYQDIDFLRATDFVEATNTGETPAFEDLMEQTHVVDTTLTVYDRSDDAVSEFEEEQFRLTPKGCEYAETRVWSKLSAQQIEGLVAFKERLAGAPLIAILKYVYEKYPDKTTKSEIKGKVLR